MVHKIAHSIPAWHYYSVVYQSILSPSSNWSCLFIFYICLCYFIINLRASVNSKSMFLLVWLNVDVMNDEISIVGCKKYTLCLIWCVVSVVRVYVHLNHRQSWWITVMLINMWCRTAVVPCKYMLVGSGLNVSCDIDRCAPSTALILEYLLIYLWFTLVMPT